MTVPQNTVFADGGPAVTGDNLNTFVQVCPTVDDARGFIGSALMQIYLEGYASPGDGGQGPFYWNAAGNVADDNGVTTIIPNGSAAGEWTRLPLIPQAASRAHNQPTNPPGVASVTPVMMGVPMAVTPTLTGAFLILLSGNISLQEDNAGCSIFGQIGTGALPVFGQAIRGTTFGQVNYTDLGPNNGLIVPFIVQAYTTGATVGNPLWIDYAVSVTNGAAALATESMTAIEL